MSVDNKPVLPKAMFVLSSALIIFAYGLAAGANRLFPYRPIAFGFDALRTVYNDWRTIAGVHPEDFLREARSDGEGVTRLKEHAASPGYTLIAGFFEDSNELRLIRLDGSVVRRWPVRFTELFSDADHVLPEWTRARSDWGTDIHGAIALPDGSVVFNFEYHGLVKLDRCGAVEWTLDRMTHHSVEPAEAGGFWVPGRRYVPAGSSDFDVFPGPYREDTVLRVSPEGEVVDEFSVPALFFENGLEHLLLANGDYYVWAAGQSDAELVHLNDVEELSPEMAASFPGFEAGDLVLSLRHLNLVMVIDPVTRRVKWHRTGPWIRQHDPDFQADGTITVFDNRTDATNDGSVFGGSRIVMVDPESGGTSIRYGAGPDQHFYTKVRGAHQILPNGNALVVEAIWGRIFEATPGGEIVWEYVNRYDDDEVARVSNATRYPESFFHVTDWSCDMTSAEED